MSESAAPCGHRPTLSEEQSRVLETWQDGRRLLVVIAKAGSGKTRTAAALSCLALASDPRVLLLSFTKNGIKELAAELVQRHGVIFEKVTGSHWQSETLMLRTFDSMLAWTLMEMDVAEARREQARIPWQVTELQRIGGVELSRAGQEHGLWTPYTKQQLS